MASGTSMPNENETQSIAPESQCKDISNEAASVLTQSSYGTSLLWYFSIEKLMICMEALYNDYEYMAPHFCSCIS